MHTTVIDNEIMTYNLIIERDFQILQPLHSLRKIIIIVKKW